MHWFIYAILSVVGAAAANILRHILMKDDKSDAIAVAFIFQIFGAGIIALIAVFNGFIFPPIGQYPLNFFLQAALWGTATFFLFKATHYLEASKVTIISTLTSIVAIFASVALLGEQFKLPYIFGTLLIVFSVVYISSNSKKMTSKGALYALGHSIFAGLGITNDAYLLRYSDTLSFLTIGFLTTGLFLILIKPMSVQKINYILTSAIIPKIAFLSIFYALASIAFFKAIQSGGQVSQVSPINQSAIIVTVFLATVFLKEKDHLLKKVVCAIVVTMGVLLLR